MRGAGALLRVVAGSALALALQTEMARAIDSGGPPGASSCSGCHASGSAMPPIHGRPADEIIAALAEFRSGGRPATVMNRIAPGFSAEESQAIAAWFSAQPGPR